MNRLIKLCFLVAIFAVCSEKEEEPEVLEVVNISNTPGRSEFPAIAADSRGYFYVVWEERAPNGIMAVYMTQKPPGGNWTTPNYIINPQTSMRQPDIAIDKENTIHVVGQYTNPQGWAEVFYTKKPLGGNWSELEIIGMYGMAAVPKIAVDNYGNVHIVWQELVGYWPIIYAKRTKDGLWSAPVEISKDGGVYYTSELKIRIDETGYVHAVWTEVKTGPGPEAIIYATNAPDGSWLTPIELCRDFQLMIDPQLVITDDRTIYVVWSMRNDIFCTSKSLSSNWSTPARICSTEAISSWPALGGINNELHLLWSEGIDPDTMYYFKKGNEWQLVKKFISSALIGRKAIAFGPITIGIVFNAGHPPDWDNEELYFCEIPRD